MRHSSLCRQRSNGGDHILVAENDSVADLVVATRGCPPRNRAPRITPSLRPMSGGCAPRGAPRPPTRGRGSGWAYRCGPMRDAVVDAVVSFGSLWQPPGHNGIHNRIPHRRPPTVRSRRSGSSPRRTPPPSPAARAPLGRNSLRSGGITLVDSRRRTEELRELKPDATGGEMEAAGSTRWAPER
jgi:hypothetical protein